MRYNEYNYKVNTMRIATDLHAEVVGLIDKYNKYKKEIALNSSKLRDFLNEKSDDYDDIKYEELRFQYELSSYLPTLQEQIEELDMLLVKIETYQKSPNDIKAFEIFIIDKKEILINMLKLAPKISLDDIANLNGRKNEFQSIFQDFNESSYKLNNRINQTKEFIDSLFYKNCFSEKNKTYDYYKNILEFRMNKEYMKYIEGEFFNRNGRKNGFQPIFQDFNESSYKLNNKINQTTNSIDSLYYKNCFYENNKSYDGYNYIREFKGNEEYIKYLEGEVANLNSHLENKELDKDKISEIKAEIEDYKEYSKILLEENSELKVYFEQAGISLQDKNVNILNVFELTTNDVIEQLTLSLAGFKVLDAHAINDAAIKVEPIKPFIPMVPQVN
ncbi:hypothetical protein ACBQ54_10935 [Providencia vermicola]|uniref:hypothetical protein n=1 Tax=Providencia vermicola TaxID=333965 RepID=UPI0035250211